MFGKGGKGAGVCKRTASQSEWRELPKAYHSHHLQEAEQAAYANVQVAAGQAATDVPTQDVRPTVAATNAADTGAMDVDRDAVARGITGEGHGGTKRKAGEDAVSAAKKPRTGMFVISSHPLTTDTTIACRTCRCCSEEVNFVVVFELSVSDNRLQRSRKLHSICF